MNEAMEQPAIDGATEQPHEDDEFNTSVGPFRTWLANNKDIEFSVRQASIKNRWDVMLGGSVIYQRVPNNVIADKFADDLNCIVSEHRAALEVMIEQIETKFRAAIEYIGAQS